ncbi:hypothetical protein CAPTEDRAFT_212144 [Capitella teleta]|uniref:Uncharacterized protein n=1 Tax=Capitella teleta TaxID=283909 RepID=R7T4M7_CAPTE|nr:hypothetical protein CAPTEDRAFT_212144 [Capitella teleta]|eukprot:ELT87898.1 hypothetical protein CAPTEDRAFT_212144 [Capitella teleta]
MLPIKVKSKVSFEPCIFSTEVDGTTHCYPAYFTDVTQVQISLSQFFRREQTIPKNHLRSGYCRVYNISSQDPDVSWTITDACWDSIQTDSVYALSLTSNADQLTYVISTPANFSFLLDPPSLPDWHTVVAIAVLPSNKSILTSFQLAPASSAVTSYLVHLHDVETPPHYSLYQNITNESWTVFPSLPPLKVEYQLTIKINNCDQCVETWASSILLPVAPEKVTTPKPLVSPKAVITMATDDYSDLSTWTDRMSSDDYEGWFIFLI